MRGMIVNRRARQVASVNTQRVARLRRVVWPLAASAKDSQSCPQPSSTSLDKADASGMAEM